MLTNAARHAFSPEVFIEKGKTMKIGKLALATQSRVETIRYYEREGLLPQAPRSEGNYRIYGPEHVERLAFVRHCLGRRRNPRAAASEGRASGRVR